MTLPSIKLRVPSQDLAALASLLRESGYTEASLCSLLGIGDLSLLNGSKLDDYIACCQKSGSQLAQFVKLFLLGEGLPRREVSLLLGRDLLSTLTLCGLLFRSSGSIFCHAVIYPCADQYIVTDYWVSKFQTEGKIYELGTDSYVLSRVTPRNGRSKALDLCTGSGVHAVQSAVVCGHSSAVDINPRALNYAHFNAALNSVSCDLFLGDLYQPLPASRFDLITANPPFVPSPDPDILVHRSAGESGEEVPERLVSGLPEQLSEGGLYSMVLEFPVTMKESYLERLERWLGQKSGWGIAVLSFGERSINSYIDLHVTDVENRDEMVEKYRASYQKQGIVSIEFANVFILRLPSTVPNWKMKASSVWPRENRSASIAQWLNSASKYLTPDFALEAEWKPKLHQRIQSFSPERGLEAVDPTWLIFEQGSPLESEVLAKIDGRLSFTELLSSLNVERTELEATLRALASRLIID